MYYAGTENYIVIKVLSPTVNVEAVYPFLKYCIETI